MEIRYFSRNSYFICLGRIIPARRKRIRAQHEKKTLWEEMLRIWYQPFMTVDEQVRMNFRIRFSNKEILHPLAHKHSVVITIRNWRDWAENSVCSKDWPCSFKLQQIEMEKWMIIDVAATCGSEEICGITGQTKTIVWSQRYHISTQPSTLTTGC